MAIDEVLRQTLGLGRGRGQVRSHAVAKRQFASAEEALRVFEERRDWLLDVNGWSRLSGLENARFALYDAAGRRAYRPVAAVGDFVAIALPLAGWVRTDWVRLERIDAAGDRLALVLRPSHDPTRRPLAPQLTAHFFAREATNRLSLERRGPWLIARVEGRNECANTAAECPNAAMALANRVLAEGGWGGPGLSPQRRQWERFTRGLVG